MPNLVGIGLSQVPTNSMLGGMAYQDPEHASIKDLDLKNLSQINSEINDTAVDVFVYDTRKDSDGGAWRKRTQHTSWYNETLNTATRGSRREFPSVAVIVAEATQLTIYDGDDPDLPMWMVFNLSGAVGVACNMLSRGGSGSESDITSVAFFNAKLVVGLKDVSGSVGEGLVEVNFISDFGRVYREVGSSFTGAIYNLPISGRNSNSGYHGDYDSLAIIAQTVNDVAMTVLPNAPIDDSTGLPIPTIAVGTDSGASIIKDDGSVVDITITTGTNYDVEHIDFTDDNRVVILWNAGAGEISIDEIPATDISANYPINLPGTYYNDHSPTSYSPNFLTEGPSLSNRIPAAIQQFRAVGTTAALSVFEENKESEEDGMVAFISSSYNTGYQQGRIRGAFLSDTDDTNAIEYIQNGYFNSDVSSWTIGSTGTTATLSANRMLITAPTSGSSWGYVYQGITTEIGKTYKISLHYDRGNVDGRINVRNDSSNTTAGALFYADLGTGDDGKTYYNTFTATATTTYILLYAKSTSGGTSAYDAVSVTLEKDRSVNNKGLQVYGTVPKQVVATGAELVSYGPFNNSNNFRQPYNSDLNFEQNDFSIMFWVYDTGVNQHCTLISRDEREFDISRLGAAFGSKLRIYTRNSAEDLRGPDSASALPFNKWVCVCVVYTGGNTKKVYLDGVLDTTITGTNGEYDIDSTSYGLNIGVRNTGGTKNYSAGGVQLALMRISGSAPSAEQIKKIYNDEKHLFEENSKATLYGSSDPVTALAYDDSNNVLHVGTSAGRSEFQGLRRINNTTTAVTTAISASNGLVAEQ